MSTPCGNKLEETLHVDKGFVVVNDVGGAVEPVSLVNLSV